jgi:outer membrane protein OmpA-like peptidoglycan-associated protein
MGRALCLIALLTIAFGLTEIKPARSQSSDTDAKVRDTNEIINRLGTRTRGFKKDLPHECEEALANPGAATRSPSKKERETVEECTKTSTKLDFIIPFALNSAEIAASALPQLQNIGKAMESDALKTFTFVVAGHTDRRGDLDYNIKLSQQRAEAVRIYLMENFDVAGRRLKAVGFGYEVPKVPEDPYADANRRVELIRTN